MLNSLLKEHIPVGMDDRDQLAFNLVPKVLDQVLGLRSNGGWHTFQGRCHASHQTPS